MVPITEGIRALLRGCRFWDNSGAIRLECKWQCLGDGVIQAPCETGLYALGLPAGLQYDGGPSRIVYIGSTTNLHKRFAQHNATPHNYEIAELHRAFPEGLWVSWWPIPTIDRRWLYGLEGEAICQFERVFGTVPIANTGIPDVSFASDCRGLVQIARCPTLPNAISLDELSKLLSGVRVRKRFRPGGYGQSVTACQVFYHEVSLPAANELAERQCERETEHLATIWEEHIAAWSIDKVRGLLQVCTSLKPLRVTEGSRVRRCEAPTADVPSPHTWGEVALVQGRLVAGSWSPAKKVWVKIIHRKQVLGQAFLEDWGCRGEDVTPSQQVEQPRPSYWQTYEAEEPVALESLHEHNRQACKKLRDTIEDVFLRARSPNEPS